VTRFTPSFRKVVATVGVAAVAALGVPSMASAAGVEGTDAVKIDTYSTWDGSSYVQPFGHADTATYGQTITASADGKKIKNFAFYMSSNFGTGTMKLRGAVYAWDGDSATGNALWESKKAKNVKFTQGDPEVKKVAFKTKKAKAMTPGQKYVLFASVSKDYEETAPNVLSQWAAHFADVLPGGDVVFLNNGGDESQWTGGTWTTFTGFDFAMTANIK
jgi:hypothetical protein